MPLPLTDTQLRNLKPRAANYKRSDGGGLYVLVTPGGSKLWQMAYRFNGRHKTLSFGPYPLVSLRDARDRRDEAKRLLVRGLDPGEEKKRAKALALAQADAARDSFRDVAEEWQALHARRVVPPYALRIRRCLETRIFPLIGDKNVGDIAPADILSLARAQEQRGCPALAHELALYCGQILRYAVLCGKTPHDAAARLSMHLSTHLRGALLPRKKRPFAAILEPAAIGALLRDIDANTQASRQVRYFLKILPYVFVRPSELREARWEEFTDDLWIIPAARMKVRRPHTVPLSRQVRALLAELRVGSAPMVGAGAGPPDDSCLFPGHKRGAATIDASSVNKALRRLGYQNLMTLHGFRAMASTRLNEMRHRPDVIEACLAHKEPNATRAAYNRAEYLDERRTLMQAWADYLDALRASGGQGLRPWNPAGD